VDCPRRWLDDLVGDSGVQTLFVASAGGHLEELWSLRPRFTGLEGECRWLTFDTPQSRSLLRHEQRTFIPPARPRDARATVVHTRLAMHVLGLGRWKAVVSTGCLPAVPFLTLARTRGIECHFIDSATRVEGPSLSATLLDKVPGVHRYCQYRWPDRPGWHYRGSIFDDYAGEARGRRDVRRVVVTVGTSDYSFRRLVAAAHAAVPADAEVLWQTGATDTSGLALSPRPLVPDDDLRRAMAAADVVICHAGVGSALAAFGAGHCPIIVPRRRARGEHVDDHQEQLATELAGRGLAIAVEADQLTSEVIDRAASRRVVGNEDPPPFILGSPAPPDRPDGAASGPARRPGRRAAA